jgi:hypothetical protein
MKWFRLYASVLHDPKVQKLPPALFKHWINILCLASEADEDGRLPDRDAIAYALHIYPKQCDKVLEQLVTHGLVERDLLQRYCVHRWSSRQKVSDNSAGRVSEYRQRQSAPIAGSGHTNDQNVTLQPRYTKRDGNALDGDIDIEEKRILYPLSVNSHYTGAAGRANQQHAPEKKSDQNAILLKVADATKAKYTPEEIERQFERALGWLEEHPTARMTPKFFGDWLEREIDQGRWVPANLSEIEKLKRLRESKPDEKGLYHDGRETYTAYRLRQKIEELETMEVVLAREKRDRELRATSDAALHNGHQTSVVSRETSHQDTPT